MRAPEEFGSYLVYEQLGVGGMASVHIAESRGLRKRVALKRLLEHAADSPELVQSFIHEARLVGHLKHTNIAQTYDFGKVGDTYFIAMELVPGPTVGQLIRHCKSTVGIVPIPITLNILCQVCDALAYAHNLAAENGTPLGLVHRDVSPPNIIVSNTGTVKLIDFGVAKIARSGTQTQVGVVKGKFSYMAPEYLDGKLDSRVDLWALGAVAHELLTNRNLFDAPDDLGVLEKVRRAPIIPPSRVNPDVPRDLDAVVLTALQRNPAQRWQTAAAMRTALAAIANELETVSNAQMIQWIEWAFTQVAGQERSGVSQLIALLEKPSEPGVAKPKLEPNVRSAPAGKIDVASRVKRTAANVDVVAEPNLEFDDEVTRYRGADPTDRDPTDRRPEAEASRPPKRSIFPTRPRVGAAMVKRRGKRRGVFLWLLLLVIAAFVGLAIYFFETDLTRSF